METKKRNIIIAIIILVIILGVIFFLWLRSRSLQITNTENRGKFALFAPQKNKNITGNGGRGSGTGSGFDTIDTSNTNTTGISGNKPTIIETIKNIFSGNGTNNGNTNNKVNFNTIGTGTNLKNQVVNKDGLPVDVVNTTGGGVINVGTGTSTTGGFTTTSDADMCSNISGFQSTIPTGKRLTFRIKEPEGDVTYEEDGTLIADERIFPKPDPNNPILGFSISSQGLFGMTTKIKIKECLNLIPDTSSVTGNNLLRCAPAPKKYVTPTGVIPGSDEDNMNRVMERYWDMWTYPERYIANCTWTDTEKQEEFEKGKTDIRNTFSKIGELIAIDRTVQLAKVAQNAIISDNERYTHLFEDCTKLVNEFWGNGRLNVIKMQGSHNIAKKTLKDLITTNQISLSSKELRAVILRELSNTKNPQFKENILDQEPGNISWYHAKTDNYTKDLIQTEVSFIRAQNKTVTYVAGSGSINSVVPKPPANNYAYSGAYLTKFPKNIWEMIDQDKQKNLYCMLNGWLTSYVLQPDKYTGFDEGDPDDAGAMLTYGVLCDNITTPPFVSAYINKDAIYQSVSNRVEDSGPLKAAPTSQGVYQQITRSNWYSFSRINAIFEFFKDEE